MSPTSLPPNPFRVEEGDHRRLVHTVSDLSMQVAAMRQEIADLRATVIRQQPPPLVTRE